MKIKRTLTTCLLSLSMIVHNTEGKTPDCVTLRTGRYTGCEYLCEVCLSELDTTQFYFENGACKGCSGDTRHDVEYKCCKSTQIII